MAKNLAGHRYEIVGIDSLNDCDDVALKKARLANDRNAEFDLANSAQTYARVKSSRQANAQHIWQTASEFEGLHVTEFHSRAACANDYTHAIGCEHAVYKCYVFVKPEQLAKGWSHDRIMNETVSHEVLCFSGSCSEACRVKAFDGIGWRLEQSLPVSQELGETSSMFSCHPILTYAKINKTFQVSKDVMVTANNQQVAI